MISEVQTQSKWLIWLCCSSLGLRDRCSLCVLDALASRVALAVTSFGMGDVKAVYAGPGIGTIGYRLDDAITGMINFQVSPSVRIGYAYDSTQSELNFYTKSSHEIFINFDISFRSKVSRSPRYF